jgi:hypothetical protein
MRRSQRQMPSTDPVPGHPGPQFVDPALPCPSLTTKISRQLRSTFDGGLTARSITSPAILLVSTLNENRCKRAPSARLPARHDVGVPHLWCVLRLRRARFELCAVWLDDRANPPAVLRGSKPIAGATQAKRPRCRTRASAPFRMRRHRKRTDNRPRHRSRRDKR